MNDCTVGSIIFGWYAGLNSMIRIGKKGIKAQIGIEAGNTIGNKSSIKSSEVHSSKLIKIETGLDDIEEMLTYLKNINNYYELEFMNKDTVSDNMLSMFNEFYKGKKRDMEISYAKVMSCFGVEIMHRGDLKDIINLEAMDNKDINEIGVDFLIIKLIESKFLKKIMNGSYVDKSKDWKKKILEKNLLSIAVPLTQIEEINNDFENFVRNKMQ